jgi:MFS family permease
VPGRCRNIWWLTHDASTFTCLAIIPMAGRIARDLAGDADAEQQKAASVLLVTIWELGEAAGPLLIAPMSESKGRSLVLNAANTLFVLATLLAALAHGTALFVSARALTGLAVATNVLCPAIVGDMFAPSQRGAPMSLVMLTPLLGGATGPAVGGALAERFGWRAVVFVSAALAGVCEVMFLVFFRETYKPVIVARKCRADAQWAREACSGGGGGLDDSELVLEPASTWGAVWEAVMRPAVVLSGSLVLQLLALFGSVVFAYFYVMSVSLPDILQHVYGLSESMTGTAFLCFSVGSSISVLVCNTLVDRIYGRLSAQNGGVGQPEYRLPLVVASATLLPLAIALYGWSAALHWPLPVQLASVGLIGAAMLVGWIPLLGYVVDAFSDYAASALTGLIVMRCLMGTFLPLTVPWLVERFGYGWGFMFFVGASACLAPLPVLILRYGGRWRQWSAYSRDQ